MMLIHEVIKNLRIIVRDRTSLGLLLVGPIIIILLTGFLFGKGLDLKNLNIGVFVDGESLLVDEMLDSLDGVGSIVRYDDLESCLDKLRREKIHLCLNVKQDPADSSGQPRASVRIYSNNTGSKLWVNMIVPHVQLLIEASSYRISVASTENFLDIIQNLHTNLRDRQGALRGFLDQLNNSNTVLQRNRVALAGFQKIFRTNTKKIQDAEEALNKQSASIIETIDTLTTQIDTLENASETLQAAVGAMTATDQKAQGLLESIFALPGKITTEQTTSAVNALPFTLTLENVQETLDQLQSNTKNLRAEFSQLESNVEETSTSINKFTKLMENEAAAEGAMLYQISSTASLLQNINSELDQDLSKLSVFEGVLADNIIRPIIQEHTPVGDFRTIEVLFSIIMIMLLTFIATIFANIISLEEINSSAHFRNIISPTSNQLFLFGAVLTNCLLVGIQFTAFILVAQFQFQVDVMKHISQLSIILFLYTAIFTMLGITTAYLIKKQQLSILVSVFIALGLFLFSNAFYPLELMPEAGAAIAAFNPVGITETMSRLLVLYDIPITDTPLHLYTLCGLVVGSLILALYANHRFNEKLK